VREQETERGDQRSMKYTNECPICGANPWATFRKNIDLDAYSSYQRLIAEPLYKFVGEKNPEEVISFCRECRSVYRAKFFDDQEISDIYNRLYFQLEEALAGDPSFGYDNPVFLDGLSKKMLGIVKGIESRFNVKIKDVFDIGGRDGFRLKALAEAGYSCKVFDPIECTVCDNRISKERFFSPDIPKDQKADFIFLCNVLEHSIEPQKMIAECHAHLKDGGFLYIELPADIQTVFDWLIFTRWMGKNLSIDNTHYIFFSRKTVATLLESKGFESVERKFSVLPNTSVTVQEHIGRRSAAGFQNETHPSLSFGFDLLSSRYFNNLLRRASSKLLRLGKARKYE